ncbi:hypothetical protein [Streptomyces sp. NPDC059918]|uniref:hypothetical protein n=1 Tax=unclassified Streptomyces TaxID=2593676 RepID=UPI003659C67D
MALSGTGLRDVPEVTGGADLRLRGRDLLLAAAAEVARRPSTSGSRARQVRWVAGEYGRALAHPEHPLGEDATAEELFRREPVEKYLELAGSGVLRLRAARDPKKHSDHSAKIRLEVLHLMVRALGVEAAAGLPPQPDPPDKEPVAERPRVLLREQLRMLADAAGSGPNRIRMLAIGATVCDTGVRAGELCACTVEDVSPSIDELRVVRRPQGAAEAEAYVELLALSDLSRTALRRWLPERRALMARVGGTATALWVSLHANHRDGQPVPAGTPLQPRGLARAWTRAVVETNGTMAGQPGWGPLPTRMEQLRRGVVPEATDAPLIPDEAKTAELLNVVAARAASLSALRAARHGATAQRAARRGLRHAVHGAWAAGVGHAVQLAVLDAAGLKDEAALAAAGWEPALLEAVDRAQGWGRPPKGAAR